MFSSESRSEVMKPLLIKAGIPVALSAAAYVCARIILKRSDSSVKSLSDRSHRNWSRPECLALEESFHSLNSTSSDYAECEDQGTEDLHVGYFGNLEDKSFGHSGNLEHKLLELETLFEDLQNKEWETETRFLQYKSLKEREFLLMIEKTRAEFLLKEISLTEDESKRMGELVIERIKLVHEVESLKAEIGLLEQKAKKQWRRAKQRMRIIKEQKQSIEARDEEILSYRKELERQDNVIQKLDDEVDQLKRAVDHLQREKIELYNKLELAEKSDSSNLKIETGSVTKEEYDKVLKELEQLQKAQTLEANEVTYLRWSNACLRHELMRCHEQLDHTKADQTPNQDSGQLDLNWVHDDEPCLCGAGSNGTVVASQARSRRRRFIEKFKRWVDGSGKMDDKEKNEEINKCFGRHSVSEEAEDQFVQSRQSCSSL